MSVGKTEKPRATLDAVSAATLARTAAARGVAGSRRGRVREKSQTATASLTI